MYFVEENAFVNGICKLSAILVFSDTVAQTKSSWLIINKTATPTSTQFQEKSGHRSQTWQEELVQDWGLSWIPIDVELPLVSGWLEMFIHWFHLYMNAIVIWVFLGQCIAPVNIFHKYYQIIKSMLITDPRKSPFKMSSHFLINESLGNTIIIYKGFTLLQKGVFYAMWLDGTQKYIWCAYISGASYMVRESHLKIQVQILIYFIDLFIYCQTSDIRWNLEGKKKCWSLRRSWSIACLSSLLQPHLHFPLNTWLQ